MTMKVQLTRKMECISPYTLKTRSSFTLNKLFLVVVNCRNIAWAAWSSCMPTSHFSCYTPYTSVQRLSHELSNSGTLSSRGQAPFRFSQFFPELLLLCRCPHYISSWCLLGLLFEETVSSMTFPFLMTLIIVRNTDPVLCRLSLDQNVSSVFFS